MKTKLTIKEIEEKIDKYFLSLEKRGYLRFFKRDSSESVGDYIGNGFMKEELKKSLFGVKE